MKMHVLPSTRGILLAACCLSSVLCCGPALGMAQPGDAVGRKVESKARKVNPVPARAHVVPALAPGESLAPVPAGLRPKNIILVFGDGMGSAIAEAASYATHRAARAMLFDAFPVATVCTTWCADFPITDSAASATAFACGSKTKSGMLGQLPDGRPLRSVATLARAAGKSVGLLTNDKLEGATPAAYAVHVPDRKMAKDIFAGYAGCGFDVLIGDASKQGAKAVPVLSAAGFVPVDSYSAYCAAIKANASRPVFGQIADKSFLSSDTVLANFARATIARLATSNPNGFFLLVESTEPDHGGHNNDLEQGITGVVQVDWVARAALDYAFAHKDTLVIVFADHETGGLAVMASDRGKGPIRSCYTSGWHTGVPVPLRAYGPGEELFDRVLDNTDIAKSIAALWGLQLDQ